MNQPTHDTSPVLPSEGGTQATASVRAFWAEESIGYRMRRIVNLIGAEIDRRMEPLGLTDAQWKPLLRMYLDNNDPTVAVLARGCHLDAGAMTRLLDRLETKGLCRRVRSQEDRRVVNLELTEEGRSAAEQIPGLLYDVQSLAARGFSADEHEQLRGMLQRILTNLQPLDAGGCNDTDNEGASK